MPNTAWTPIELDADVADGISDQLMQMTIEQLRAHLLRIERSVLRQERASLEILMTLQNWWRQAGGHDLIATCPANGIDGAMSITPPITNALTIDVEDYFQVSAFAPYIQRSNWDSRECRG